VSLKKEKYVLGTKDSMTGMIEDGVDANHLALLILRGLSRTLEDFMDVVPGDAVTPSVRTNVGSVAQVIDNAISVLTDEVMGAELRAAIPGLDERLSELAAKLRESMGDGEGPTENARPADA